MLTVKPGDIVFKCQRLWEPPRFLFNLTWTLQPFLGQSNIISGFIVNLELKNVTQSTSIQIDHENVSSPPVFFLKVD